jgi:hypothetical protein
MIHTGFIRNSATAFLVLMALSLGGCSSSVTVSEWQASLDQFAADYGHNDMSFLRETDDSSSRRAFTVIGTATPEKSTDITGVLLGRRTIADRQWLVFLIGRVKHREVEDIRLALRSDDAGEPKWLLSQSNADAFRQYRQHREAQWRAYHPNREAAPIHALEFPAEDDVFSLDINQNQAAVVHESSGAQWNISVRAVDLSPRQSD